MRKKIQNLFGIFILLFAFSAFTVNVQADTSADLTVNGNEVIVALHLPEGKTETITSLRLKLYVSVKSGEMKEPSFQFAEGLASEVQDAAVGQGEEGNYVVDLILSGKQKQDIFQGSEDAVIGTLVLTPENGKDFTAEAGISGEDSAETGNEQQDGDVQPVVQYVDSSGISMETLFLNNAAPVSVEYVQQKPAQPDKGEEPSTTPDQGQDTGAAAVAKVTSVSAVYKNMSKTIVSWKAAAGADGYEIWRSKKKNGNYTLKERVSARRNSKKVKHKDGKIYYYKVRAFVTDAAGSKIYGEFSGPAPAVPARPKVKADVNYDRGRVLLTWKKSVRADGYKIYQYNFRTRKYKAVAKVKKQTFWSRRIKAGSSYMFRVRAFEKKKNGKKIYGAFSAPQTVRIK